jgi:hypothetical protein
MQRTVMVHYQVHGIALPKHVAPIVKIKKYTNQCIFGLISASFGIVLLRSSSHADVCLLCYYLVCIFVTCCVLCYCVCSAVLHAVVVGLPASSRYPEGPALTGHLDTGFSWFPCV